MNQELHDTLKRYFGFDTFLDNQEPVVEDILAGKDLCVVMPTGAGKSLCYQLPILMKERYGIVVSPLISLMKDQVDHLRKKNIRAYAIYGTMQRNEILTILDNAVLGGVTLLYISPERLTSELFLTKLKHIKVSFITVDEAHCISQWGYDFRPSYLNIADIKKLKPSAPILALTATATPAVIDDIQERLQFKEKNVFKMSFERKNLTYVVRPTIDKDAEMIHILESVKGSAIVYVRSRKRTKEISDLLEANGIPSTFYHAGLSHSTKDIRQQRWHNDETRVMVATNAFGMGIDKPDVRMVIHYDSPDSIEAYFQEAGRAGRDGKRAYAVLLYDKRDTQKLIKRIDTNFPPKDYIIKVYEDLAYYYQIAAGSGYGHTFSFEIEKFCHIFKHYPLQAHSALVILARAQYIEYETDPESRARLMFLLNRNELYRLDDLTQQEDALITALLRLYGSLFVDYTFIDLGLVADYSQIPQQEIYLMLKSLSQRRILHFIPESKTPYITYTQNRELPERIVISKEVYEERKEEFTKRINAMIAYANDTTTCRSKMLLNYFGEKQDHDCGRCDVCLDNNTNQVAEEKIDPVKHQILNLLADKAPHHITEIARLTLPREQVIAALQALLDEEILIKEDSIIRMK